jgi:hypothetical protein
VVNLQRVRFYFVDGLFARGTASASAQGMHRLLLLVSLVATGCGDTVVGPAVALDEPFTLAIGQSAAVSAASLVIRFTGVTGDSRCPADALCIQGGDALVAVRVSGGGDAATFELHTGDASRASVTHRGYRITLVTLEPYPFSSRPITDADYRATFAVARA